jgi:hypothetical protein
MTKLFKYTSKLGFSILIPQDWGEPSENVENIDLVEKERERQAKWLNIKESKNLTDKPFALFLATVEGLGTGFLTFRATIRRYFYDNMLPKLTHDKTYPLQMKFLAPLVYHLSESERSRKTSATELLLLLQAMTDRDRLQAKEKLGGQSGYLQLSDNKNQNRAMLSVVKLNLKEHMTAIELYKAYKQSLPVWFWSGIPDKIRKIKNITADEQEIVVVENYLYLEEPESVDAYGVKGNTGWVINCSSVVSWPKYRNLFDGIIESFCIEHT